MSEANMEMAQVVYEMLCTTLDNMKIKYERHDEDHVVTLGHRGEDLNHRLLLIINEKQEAVTMVEALPFSVDSAKAADIACAACLVNKRLLAGQFTYDLGEELCFEVTQIYSGSLIGEETLKRMLLALIFTVEEYDDKFMALNKGYLSVDDFKAK